jgi:hypothetical protein
MKTKFKGDNPSKLSCAEPIFYQKRFVNFMKQNVTKLAPRKDRITFAKLKI